MLRIFVAGAALGITASAAAPVAAQPATDRVVVADRIVVTAKNAMSVKEYFDNPQYGTMALSADGTHMLVTTPINGRLNIAVIELATRKGVALTNFSEFDVLDPRWVGSSRIVFSLPASALSAAAGALSPSSARAAAGARLTSRNRAWALIGRPRGGEGRNGRRRTS